MDIEVFLSKTPRNTFEFLQSAFSAKYHAPMPRVCVSASGKPFFEETFRPICFNVSHSGQYIVCAFDDEEIGIDIQKIRRVPKNVASRYLLTDSEEPSKQILEWTKLESYGKMLGTSIPLADGDDYRRGHFLSVFQISGYILTICLQTDKFHGIEIVYI